MYSVVLMAALTAGGSAPDCHWGCGGCYGCCGCYGGCYGCSGCYGCYGCCGGCWGCYGCYGGCYGCYGGCYGCHGCYGCYGCSGCYGYAPAYVTPVVPEAAPLAAPPAAPPAPPEAAPAPKKEGSGTTVLPNKARVIVQVPADAKLFIDDQLMRATSERRVFNTPALDVVQEYFYDVRAEVVRNGKTYSETKRVIVKAGAEVRTSFVSLANAAAAAKAVANAN